MTDIAQKPMTGRKGGRTKKRVEPSTHRGFRILDRHWSLLVNLTLEAQSFANDKRTPSDVLHDMLEERYLQYQENAAEKKSVTACTNEACMGLSEDP